MVSEAKVGWRIDDCGIQTGAFTVCLLDETWWDLLIVTLMSKCVQVRG